MKPVRQRNASVELSNPRGGKKASRNQKTVTLYLGQRLPLGHITYRQSDTGTARPKPAGPSARPNCRSPAACTKPPRAPPASRAAPPSAPRPPRPTPPVCEPWPCERRPGRRQTGSNPSPGQAEGGGRVAPARQVLPLPPAAAAQVSRTRSANQPTYTYCARAALAPPIALLTLRSDWPSGAQRDGVMGTRVRRCRLRGEIGSGRYW